MVRLMVVQPLILMMSDDLTYPPMDKRIYNLLVGRHEDR